MLQIYFKLIEYERLIYITILLLMIKLYYIIKIKV